MKTNFLKGKSIQLTRNELKEINGGLSGVATSTIGSGAATASAICEDGRRVSCSAEGTCDSKDNVGCWCEDGTKEDC